MTLRALDMYERLLRIDGVKSNHSNYDEYDFDHQIVRHFMDDILSTPRKRDFKNTSFFKSDFENQRSRKYVPSDGSRQLFQERLKMIQDQQHQLWFTYRRSKFGK